MADILKNYSAEELDDFLTDSKSIDNIVFEGGDLGIVVETGDVGLLKVDWYHTGNISEELSVIDLKQLTRYEFKMILLNILKQGKSYAQTEINSNEVYNFMNLIAPQLKQKPRKMKTTSKDGSVTPLFVGIFVLFIVYAIK